MLMLARSESRSRLFFKAAPAAFFGKQKKKESLVVVTRHDSFNGKCDPESVSV